MSRTRSGCVILLLSLSWAGCSKLDTLGLDGEVTFDGQPASTGTVSFEPQDPNTGTFVATTIQDGKYALPAEKGVKPGAYRVRISAPDLSSAPPQAAHAEGSVAIPELIPAGRYVTGQDIFVGGGTSLPQKVLELIRLNLSPNLSPNLALAPKGGEQTKVKD